MPKNTKPKPDAENPEWTADMFRRAKRLNELPSNVQAAFKRKGRGPQKTPTKIAVSLRLSPDVLKALRSKGAGWQGLVDEALRSRFVKAGAASKKAKTKAA